jgi:cytochrome c
MTIHSGTIVRAALVLAMGGMLASGSDAAEHTQAAEAGGEVPVGLFIPEMSAERGRELFATKGCVICHSVNDIGGHHTPFDAETMDMPMNAFEFAARMWRGAEPMVMLMRHELDYVIELSGQELADIVAFVHDEEEQSKFSLEDVPEQYRGLIERDHDHGHGHDHDMPHRH